MEKKRLVGLKIVGIINLIVGLLITIFFAFIALGVLLGFGEYNTKTFTFFDWLNFFFVKVTVLALYLFSGPLLFLSGLAMLRKEAYGRTLSIISASIIMATTLYWISVEFIELGYFETRDLYFLSSFFIYAALLIIFLTHPKVRQQFMEWNP